MFPPWPSQKILVLQHHNLKKLPLSMSQWISWGTIPKSDYDAYCIRLWYSLVKFLDPTHGITEVLILASCFLFQRYTRSRDENAAKELQRLQETDQLGSSKKRTKSFESWRKIIEQGQTWTNHQTQKKHELFFGVCFFVAGMPRVGWVLFSHSLFRILQKRNIGRTYSIDRHARTENLSNRNDL